MFELWCPTDESRVLRWTSHVLEVIHPSPGAIDLLVQCACGELALVMTGRAREGHEKIVHGIPTFTEAAA